MLTLAGSTWRFCPRDCSFRILSSFDQPISKLVLRTSRRSLHLVLKVSVTPQFSCACPLRTLQLFMTVLSFCIGVWSLIYVASTHPRASSVVWGYISQCYKIMDTCSHPTVNIVLNQLLWTSCLYSLAHEHCHVLCPRIG